MGFLDKAKQLAEQAQQKLDDAQKNFNQGGSPQSQPGEGEVKYDEHGRPIQETPPAGAAAPDPTAPIADPAAPSPAAPADPAAAAPAPAPPADPASPSPPPDPASERDPSGTEGDPSGTEGDPAHTESHPAGPEPTRQPETPDRGQPNASPDPFKPLQQ